MNNKIGRPTKSPKDLTLKIRIDDTTNKELEYIMSIQNKNKSEIVRDAIKAYYDKIKENVK